MYRHIVTLLQVNRNKSIFLTKFLIYEYLILNYKIYTINNTPHTKWLTLFNIKSRLKKLLTENKSKYFNVIIVIWMKL